MGNSILDEELKQGMLEDELDDDLVINDILNGNKQQFKILMQRYDKKLYIHLKRRFFFSPEDMDDVMQDAFIRSYKSLRTFKKGRSFYPWLVKIAENVCKDYLKKKSNRKRLKELYPPRDNISERNELNDEILGLETITEAIKKLPQNQREVLILRAEGYSYAEISEKLDVPQGTVMSRLNRARISLQEKLAYLKMQVGEK